MATKIPDAKAAYNFVPYEPKAVIDDWEDGGERWSGSITCRLKTLSPLMVSGAQKSGDKEESRHCRFLKIDGKPVVPGSSLKGMLRNIIEILSFSRMSPVSRAPIFYRDVTDKIYLADMENVGGGFLRLKNATYEIARVNIDKTGGSKRLLDEYIEFLEEKRPFGGVVGNGGFPPGVYKTFYTFSSPDPDSYKPIDRAVYEDFFSQLTEDQKKRWREKRLKTDLGHPVFFREENGEIVELGLTRLFRRKYKYNASDLPYLEDAGRNDFATRLFGRVDPALKGKIAVGPAFFTDYKEAAPRAVVLGGPKTTCLPHYLEQDRKKLKPLKSYNAPRARLRGRKAYWHRDVFIPPNPNPENLKIVNILHPIEKDSVATFAIDFRGLTDLELGALLEAIDLPPTKAHKLGMGKPLGFGSTRLEIIDLNVEDDGRRYKSLLDRTCGEPAKLDKEAADQLRQKFRETALARVGKKFADWSSCASFEELPPIEALYLMLEWTKRPSRPKVEHMTDLDDFKIHAPLPTPRDVVGKK